MPGSTLVFDWTQQIWSPQPSKGQRPPILRSKIQNCRKIIACLFESSRGEKQAWDIHKTLLPIFWKIQTKKKQNGHGSRLVFRKYFQKCWKKNIMTHSESFVSPRAFELKGRRQSLVNEFLAWQVTLYLLARLHSKKKVLSGHPNTTCNPLQLSRQHFEKKETTRVWSALRHCNRSIIVEKSRLPVDSCSSQIKCWRVVKHCHPGKH